MDTQHRCDVNRRDFLTLALPACTLACSMTCLGAGRLFAAADEDKPKDTDPTAHKFDVEFEQKTTLRRQIGQQHRGLIEFIKSLREKMGDEELIGLLNEYSTGVGRRVGSSQAERAGVRDFQTFLEAFRPPQMDQVLTMEIVEDTPKVFGLRVTECVWASVYRDAGLGGEIGHAAVCNMDYTWPRAFNEKFRMERDHTLMQGDAYCNHRYIDTT